MVRRSLLPCLVVALVAASCGSAPSITDPREIVAKSVEALSQVRTFHVQIDVGGKVKLDLPGQAPGADLDLKGTTATVDIDAQARTIKATGAVPGFFGSGGEIIILADGGYLRITGPLAQTDKYIKIAGPSPRPSQAASAGANSPDPKEIFVQLRDALARLPAPVIRAVEKCGDADCYHVTLSVTAADLANLLPGTPSPIPAGASGVLDLYSRTSDLRPAKLAFTVRMGDGGELTGTIQATYDQPLSISAPPADQVVEGSAPFPIPSFAP